LPNNPIFRGGSAAYLSVGTPVQLAAPVLLATRSSFQRQVMQRLQTNLRELDAQFWQSSRHAIANPHVID